jgi:hypothetical protein
VTNPLENDAEREAKVRERAYRLWEQEDRPHGRDLEFWERARELIGMEESAGAGQIPNPATSDKPAVQVEEAEIQTNLGEFPSQMTDQGDRPQAPKARRKRRG